MPAAAATVVAGINTRRAAAYLDLSPRTLDGYRVSGEGPAFHRFGNRVRYRRTDLESPFMDDNG